MKQSILNLTFLASLAIPALAGETASYAKEPIPEPLPPAEPSRFEWFIGATVGYLDDYDTEFYSAHIGVDMPYQLGGWDTAVYLEVGYFEEDWDFGTIQVGDSQFDLTPELEVIPVSVIYKLERAIANNRNCYFGGGAGAAYVDLSFLGESDDDWTFFGQVFAGFLYNFNETFEGYLGGRWIYIDDVDMLGVDNLLDAGDDFLVEGGIRINF